MGKTLLYVIKPVLTLYGMIPLPLKKDAFKVAKGHISGGKRYPFGVRNVSFCRTPMYKGKADYEETDGRNGMGGVQINSY